MTDTCEWQRLLTGEPMCDQPGVYRARYDDCPICPGETCTGALVCVEHAADQRSRASEVGLLELTTAGPS